MKITDVEVLILRSDNLNENIADGSQEACIIKVHTDEGITGLGEVDSVPTIVKAIVEAPSSHSVSHGLKKLVVGEDPFEVEKIWEKMYQGTMYHGRRAAVIHAISGIDMALWDIMGKAVNKPVYKLLGGGFRKKIRAYASLLMPEKVAEVKRLTTSYVEQGYTAVKLGWGPLGQDEKQDVRLVAAAREAIGDDVDLMIDAGLCYNVNSAIRMGKKFEEFNLFWFEEPCWADNFDHYARISEAVNIPIAAGE
ncbi:MAG: mandelate racemase/muconate lactonizing enzyme family protein, partial [Eubacteriales bacterium]